jgi:hypothetical protein
MVKLAAILALLATSACVFKAESINPDSCKSLCEPGKVSKWSTLECECEGPAAQAACK